MEDRLSERDEGPSKIKVVDRRRFDGSGDPRPDVPKAEPKPVARPAREATEPAARPAKDPSKPETASRAPEPQPGKKTSPLFLDLVAGLAQQAEILMTGGQGMPAQPAESQRVIEYLAMLESKTTGNLSTEEAQILSNVIFQLRSLFLQKNK
jgi:hypothetical protein